MALPTKTRKSSNNRKRTLFTQQETQVCARPRLPRGRRWVSWPHLGLPELIVHHGEVQAQLLHVAIIALEEKQVLVHFRIQGREVMDVHVSAGSQQLGQEEACKGQLHQHVLVEGLG